METRSKNRARASRILSHVQVACLNSLKPQGTSGVRQSASWDWTHDGQAVKLTVRKGNEASVVEVYLFGAHVTRWEETGRPSYLYLSDTAIMDRSKSIRGGIPLIFPQFGGLGPLKSHGFARSSVWKVVPELSSSSQPRLSNAVSVTFRLCPDEAISAVWPHKFVAEYTVSLSGHTDSTLQLAFKVHNVDTTAFSFSTALHAYWNISGVQNVAVAGLENVLVEDKIAKTSRTQKGPLTFDSETDSIFASTPPLLTVKDDGYHRTLVMQKSGYPDAVVWNPHEAGAKGMSDLSDYNSMLCVEPAAIRSMVVVPPGGSWMGVAHHAWSQ